MAEATERTVETPDRFPPADLPIVFADGVLNLQPGDQLVKFYLYRFDPAADGSDGQRVTISGQVVMSLTAFVHTSVFFEKITAQLVADRLITEEQLNELREKVRE